MKLIKSKTAHALLMSTWMDLGLELMFNLTLKNWFLNIQP